MTSAPAVITRRMTLEAFSDADIPALASILAEPEVTKNITANGSTPELCLASAASRIDRHNRSWDERGYGVWAVKTREQEALPPGALLGWCGFAAPDIGDDPEILYGLSPQCWGRGLGREAAKAAIDWLFAATDAGGVSAVIFGRLNPVSVAIVTKLGLRQRGTMSMSDFLPDRLLAEDVLEYEIWRLGHGACADSEALLFQAPYKGGQIATLEPGRIGDIERSFCEAARARGDYAAIPRAELDRRVCEAYRRGVAEPFLAWYHMERSAWTVRD